MVPPVFLAPVIGPARPGPNPRSVVIRAPVRRPAQMRTCVRVSRCDRPPRGPGLLLRVGRAARRAAPPGPPHSRGRSVARGQLRGEAAQHSGRRGRVPRLGVGARRQSSCRPPHGGLFRGEQGCLRDLRADLARGRARFRSTRPSSTRAGWRPCSALRKRSRSGSVERCDVRWRYRSRSASRGPSSSRRSQARLRSPTACWSCRPAVSSLSSTPFPSSTCGESAPLPRASSAPPASRPFEMLPARTSMRSSSCRPRGGPPHPRARTQRDPRRVRGRRRRSMGSQRALGRRAPKSPEDIDATVVAIVDRLARRLRAARRVCRTVTLRLRFDDYTRATRAHTLTEATARRRRSSRPRASCSPWRCR